MLAAALLAPGTAWAASGDVGCIEAKLGPAAMARIGEGIAAAAGDRNAYAAAFNADREALLAARTACRTAGNWSPEAVRLAMSYLQARAAKLGAEPVLKADGLDPARLASAYAALPIQDRKSLMDKVSPAVVDMVKAAAPGTRERLHVMMLLTALAGIEFYPAEFAAS